MSEQGVSATPGSLAEGLFSSEQKLLARRASVGKQPRGRIGRSSHFSEHFEGTSFRNNGRAAKKHVKIDENNSIGGFIFVPPIYVFCNLWLIFEFSEHFECKTLDKPKTDDKSCRLLRQFCRKGPDESQQTWYVVGRYAEPEAFRQQAVQAQHPPDSLCTVDDITRRALFDILTLGPVGLCKKRLQALEEMEAMRKHMEEEEEVLHSKLPPHQRKVLVGKNLLLFHSLLLKTGYGDMDLVKDMRGFDLTGVAKPSGVLPTRIKPATHTTNEPKARSAITRRSIILACGSSGDLDRDRALFARTLEERDAGWLKQVLCGDCCFRS